MFPPKCWPSECGPTYSAQHREPSQARVSPPSRSPACFSCSTPNSPDYDDAIAAAVSEHPDAKIFGSFPGIGPTLTAILLAEIGEDRSRYPCAAVLLADSGLAPVTRASGRSSSVRFRYAANRRLREASMRWAFNSLKTSPWATGAFQQARTQRGQRYHRALRGLAARWMRILWRCWTDDTTYEPSLHASAAALTASAS